MTERSTTSRFRGVYKKVVKSGRYLNTYWQATVVFKKRMVATRLFPFSADGEKMAAKFYNKTASIYYGNEAQLNLVQ